MADGRVVMVRGAAAGIGKSTVAEAVVARLRGRGVRVDHVPEEDLFVRPEFAEVADGFRSRRYAGPAVFEAAYAAVFDALRADGAWAVFDWNCAGMAGDLPWAAEAAALAGHVRRVRSSADGLRPVVLNVTGTVGEATRRALAQRGRPWVDRYVGLAAGQGHVSGGEAERIEAWVRGRDGLAAHENRALAAGGWEVRDVDGMRAARDVAEQAWRVLWTGSA